MPATLKDEFFSWAWNQAAGLLGVHEGTLLTDDAYRLGFETESWVLDSGEAPRARDWVGGLREITVELYFDTQAHALWASQEIPHAFPKTKFPHLRVEHVREQVSEDWDAAWKASFKGVDLPPYWQVLPPWEKAVGLGAKVLRLTPGAGFGTGTHETTQLCLRSIGEINEAWGGLKGCQVLDFGSGSGILSIASALCGATVDAVEIDSLAHDNARHNAGLNMEDGKIRFLETLDLCPGRFDLVIANILRPVLIEFAEALVSRLREGRCALVLSGLIESDVSLIRARFEPLLKNIGMKSAGNFQLQLTQQAEWRALTWRRD